MARRPVTLLLCSIVLGALQALAFAPFNLWYLMFVSALPLLWAFESLPRHRGGWCAYWYGVGYWLATTHWIYNSFTHFATASLWMSAVLVVFFALAMALFWLLLFELWHRFTRPLGFYAYLPTPAWLKCLLFPACWLVIEWLRSTIFQGFPWLLAGYSLMDTGIIPLAAWLPVGGVWGLSFLWMLAIACLFYILRALFDSGSTLKRSLATHCMLLLLPAVLIGASWFLPHDFTRPNGDSLSIGLVQPSIPLKEKWSAALTTRNLLMLQQLSEPLRDEVDVVLWPESAVAGAWQNHKRLLEAISQSVAPARLVSGSLRYGNLEGEREVYNSIGDFSANPGDGDTTVNSTPSGAFEEGAANEISPRFYDKRQLVPFGEFMPLYDHLSWMLRRLGFPVSNLAAAKDQTGVFSMDGMQFAASICYEVIFPRLLTPHAWRSDAILNISDDGWFGASLGPQQHFQMARARAMENGRQLVRVGNDGLTALIDHRGRVVESLPRFARDTLQVRVEGREGRTPFSHIGDWVVLPLVVVPMLFYLLLALMWRKRIE